MYWNTKSWGWCDLEWIKEENQFNGNRIIEGVDMKKIRLVGQGILTILAQTPESQPPLTLPGLSIFLCITHITCDQITIHEILESVGTISWICTLFFGGHRICNNFKKNSLSCREGEEVRGCSSGPKWIILS